MSSQRDAFAQISPGQSISGFNFVLGAHGALLANGGSFNLNFIRGITGISDDDGTPIVTHLDADFLVNTTKPESRIQLGFGAKVDVDRTEVQKNIEPAQNTESGITQSQTDIKVVAKAGAVF